LSAKLDVLTAVQTGEGVVTLITGMETSRIVLFHPGHTLETWV